MKEEIEDAASKVADSIPELAQRIQDEVVEEETGKRLEDIKKRKQARRDRKEALRQKFQELQAKNKLKSESESISDSSGINTTSKAKEDSRERQPKIASANKEGLRSKGVHPDKVSGSESLSEGIEDEVNTKVDAEDDDEEENGSGSEDDDEEESGSGSADSEDVEDAW